MEHDRKKEKECMTSEEVSRRKDRLEGHLREIDRLLGILKRNHDMIKILREDLELITRGHVITDGLISALETAATLKLYANGCAKPLKSLIYDFGVFTDSSECGEWTEEWMDWQKNAEWIYPQLTESKGHIGIRRMT